MEESWAKGYIAPGESPAPLEAPQLGGTDGEARDDAYQGSHDAAPGADFAMPLTRGRILAPFIELRNRVWRSTRSENMADYPRVELQYTRLFSRQEGTAILHGGDMGIHLPNGKTVPLAGLKDKVLCRPAGLDDQVESGWLEHIVAGFSANNCPRIFLP
jgi:hypothetical protein